MKILVKTKQKLFLEQILTLIKITKIFGFCLTGILLENYSKRMDRVFQQTNKTFDV